MIKIDFEKTSEDGLLIYRDALHLEDDHTLTDADIEALKQMRFNSWYVAITTPAVDVPIVEPDPVVEDIPVQV